MKFRKIKITERNKMISPFRSFEIINPLPKPKMPRILVNKIHKITFVEYIDFSDLNKAQVKLQR